MTGRSGPAGGPAPCLSTGPEPPPGQAEPSLPRRAGPCADHDEGEEPAMEYLALLTPVVALAVLVVLSRLEDWSLRQAPLRARRSRSEGGRR